MCSTIRHTGQRGRIAHASSELPEYQLFELYLFYRCFAFSWITGTPQCRRADLPHDFSPRVADAILGGLEQPAAALEGMAA